MPSSAYLPELHQRFSPRFASDSTSDSSTSNGVGFTGISLSGLRSAILGAPATPAFDELLNHSPASVHYVFAQFRPPRQPRNYEFGDSMVAISCRAQTGRDVLDTPDVTFGGFLTLSAFPSREILRRSYFWRIRRDRRKLKIIGHAEV